MTEEPKRVPIVDKRAAAADDDVSSAPAVDETEVELTDEVEDVQALADDRLDQLMRLKADFENFRKRTIREQTELVERASLRIVELLLPVLDDLDRAVEGARTHEADDAVLKGIDLVRAQFKAVLEAEGLERVRADGAFDPNDHEAVDSIPGDVDEPTVLEVVRPGYRLKGRVIRPALVQVTVPREGGD